MGILLYSSRKLFERIILPTEDPNLLFSINTCCNVKGRGGGEEGELCFCLGDINLGLGKK